MPNDQSASTVACGHISPDEASTEIESINLKDGFQRLKTFPLIWPYTPPKKDFVSSGFYYFPQKVVCIFCNLNIQLTPESLVVSLEHSNCPLRHSLENGNVPLSDATNYRLEKNRLISFLLTNWIAPVDPYELAECGFFRLGSGDAARCNFCRLEVRGWEQGDTARGEHEKWNANCPFLTGHAVGNVRLGEEDLSEQLTPDRAPVVMQNVTVTGEFSSVRDLGITPLTPPKYPDYAPLSTRISSYQMWPMSMLQTKEKLSEAGFYYTGRGDRVICFQCGGGLKDWGRTDEPFIEHAAWFPNCVYLIKMKGIGFIDQVQALKNAQSSNADLQSMTQTTISALTPAVVAVSSNNASCAAAPATDVSDTKETPQVTASTGYSDGDATREVLLTHACKVCLTSELGIVFLPCGHLATCVDCAPQMTSCPVCRAKINAYVRAYLP